MLPDYPITNLSKIQTDIFLAIFVDFWGENDSQIVSRYYNNLVKILEF